MLYRILILPILLTLCFSRQASAQATILNYTGAVQTYVVPAGVTQVTIDASGARGGNAQVGDTEAGGAGARLVATFTVTPGETLNVVVGGTGARNDTAGSGGGGSFVYRTATAGGLLLAAAGGGGAVFDAGGGNGSATTTAGAGAGGGGGGTGGSGGTSGGTTCGGGGGGLLTDGANGGFGAQGGKALANGAAGGGGIGAIAGGFGGGGAGTVSCSGGGGGGGYNGGGGGGGGGGIGGGGGSFSATAASISQDGVNTGNGQVTITPGEADVSITKSGPGTVFNGNNITYTVTVANSGPSDALSVSLSDPLPAGTTFVSETQNTGPSFNCVNPSPGTNGTVNCTLATLANGASATFTIVAKVISTGSISNTATVSSATPDSNGKNNSQTSTATASNSADVSITKTASGGLTAGQNVTYTITATNNGPSPATGVSVADPTPSGLTFLSNSGACTMAFPCVLGTLASGQSAVIMSTYTVSAGTSNGTTITNVASISTTASDSNPGNDTASNSGTVGASADLSITKTGPGVITSNSNVTYLITVSNAGPSNSQSVTVTDVIPANTSFVSATPSQGSCSGTATVTCSLGTIAPGSPATIALVLHVGTGTAISNTATVSAATTDPNPGNNKATTATVPLTPAPSSLTLMLLGLGGLGLYWARRRRAGAAASKAVSQTGSGPHNL